MTLIWVDAQLPPAIASWISERFGVEARPVRALVLRDSSDVAIFAAAMASRAIILTKDRDFWELSRHRRVAPQIMWLRFGNTTNRRLRQILERTFEGALARLAAGEQIVEVLDVGQPNSR